MAVKYTIPFRDDANILWRVDLDIPSYSGDPIELIGVGRTFCSIDYGASNEDLFEAIVNSSVTIHLYNKSGEIDIRELQLLDNMDGRLILYKDNILHWSGFILPEGIERLIAPNPYTVSITATDGLKLLDNLPFQGLNNWDLAIGMRFNCPLAFVREILFYRHLGITLPIRWTTSVESVEHEDDGFAGQTGWGALGQAWTDFNGENRSCLYILQGLLSAFQMRIFQSEGRWNLERVNDVCDGEYTWKEIDTLYGPSDIPNLTTGTINVNIEHPFVNENQVMMIKPAVTDMEVTYDHNQAENNLPNGDFELWPSGLGLPSYWTFAPKEGDQPTSEMHASLNKRPGNAIQLTNQSLATEEAVFTLVQDLPVDTNILFKRFLLGFTFMPSKFGFSHDSVTETIDWTNNPLKISVSLTYDDKFWYLNEFGYWQSESRGTDLGVNFIRVDREYNEFPNQAATFWVWFEGSPNVGDVLVVSIKDKVGSSGNYVDHTYTATLSEEGDLYTCLQNLLNNIPSNIDGWTVNNKAVIMDGDNRGCVRFRYYFNLGNALGRTYKSGALQEFQFIYPSVENLKVNDIATIAFQGKGGNSEILLPDMGENESGFNGKMNISFFIKPNQQYVLDDVYFRFEKNNDVYKSSIITGKRSNTEKKTLNISSSFTGFMISNIMTNYYNSGDEYQFTDGKYTGSLTGLTANAIMRTRYTPRELFQGDFNVVQNGWKFNNIYAIEGKKFMPLNSRYNIESCTVNVTALECEDGNPELSEKHYGSNDTILSNTQ